MINLEILDRQHTTIYTEINYILNEAEKDISSMDTAAAALHISKLAGSLKIHLMQEDKFLYPGLNQSVYDDIKALSTQYITEMGDLAAAYTAYKDKYNTKLKINQDIHQFIQDSKTIMKTLKTRMEKEDTELYRLIKERGL